MSTLCEAPQIELEAGTGSFHYNLYRRPQRQFCPPQCRLQIQLQRPWRLSDWVSLLALPVGFDQEGHHWPKASCQKIWKRQEMMRVNQTHLVTKITSHSKWHHCFSLLSAQITPCLLVRQSNFGPDWNISITTGWIVMKFGTDIDVPPPWLIIISDPLTSHQALSPGQNFNLFNTLHYLRPIICLGLISKC